MTYVGGIRARFIHQALYNRVQDGLTALGWFDEGRAHAPVQMLAEQKPWTEELKPIMITVSPGNASSEDWEIGSFGTEGKKIFYIDVYGDRESTGLQLAEDIVAILQGKMPSLGFAFPSITIKDYTQATPTDIFYVTVDSVRADRAQMYQHHWQRYLWQVSVVLLDYVGGDTTDDLLVDGGLPGGNFGLVIDGGRA